MADALVAAADAGDLPRVRALVERGADVDAAAETGETALMKASWGGHLAVVRFLVESGASLDARDGALWETALMHAAVGGHVGVVRFLADSGADLDATDRVGGRTALMQAAFEGHVDVVSCLAERGAALDATDRTRQTALLVAAKNNRLDVVRCLAALGADISVVNGKGQTALRVAANRGNHEVQRVLTQFVALTPQQVRATAGSAASKAALTASWFIPPFEIELLHFVHNGNVGGDFRAKWLDADVVVKLFIADASHSSFADQVQLWQRLRHPNIVKLYGACDAGTHLRFFVCENVSSGSLVEYSQAHTAEDSAVWKFLYEAALGLDYLHERNIVHGGLRCSSILIGDDGCSKLANFELSESMHTVEVATAHAPVGSVRWQSPERLRGESASFASDVYSLGMCILEALTRKIPWADDEDDAWVKHYRKHYWDPVDESESNNQPGDIHGDARKLVWRMCSQRPEKRVSLSSVVYELERFVAAESRGPNNAALGYEPVCSADDFADGVLVTLWAGVEALMGESTDPLHRLVFEELSELWEQIKASPCSHELLTQFQQVLVEFQQIVAAPAHQVRVMRLSASRASTNSLHAFHWHIQLIWRMVDDSVHAESRREARWAEQRGQHIELFVSEVSKKWLLLNDLHSEEQRQGFLSFLASEVDLRGANYTPGELEVLQKVYNDTSKKLNSTGAAFGTPKWFIPWYELRVDPWSCLGTGGFGSVYRAKWLDSDVVVKEVNVAGSGRRSSLRAPSYESGQTATSTIQETSAAKGERAAALEMFQREVNIWFGFSHPHVVRLFGACHIGRPFFVCEYATNGTLVSYVRTHPNEVWMKLHEASLGVQYLHARNVVHGDLKGNNIVIGGDEKAKVTDFGLSSGASNEDEANSKVSGASHWLAPEICEGGQPTIQSDIYSLGMCIVEVLRVVEAVQSEKDESTFPPLPWENLDNASVKVHVKNGKLPIRPKICPDNQWRLVERMCTFQPGKRIKISTVVDELEKLAAISATSPEPSASQTPCPLPESRVRASLTNVDAASPIVSAMRQLLDRARSDRSSSEARRWMLCPIYDLLWDRVVTVQSHVRYHRDREQIADLNALVAAARIATIKLQHVGSTLLELTEATLLGYALHRRLDKFIDAACLMIDPHDAVIIHNWKTRCYELLGVLTATTRASANPASAEVVEVVSSWRCCCAG